MKKLAIVAVVAFFSIGATPVSAQSYAGVYGTGNIAQAPASKARAQVGRNQSEVRRFKYDRDAGQHGITPNYYRPYYSGHRGYYGPWPP